MNEIARYGQLDSERAAEENLACRQIVKEIVNFGVTQRQLLMIVYLLATELDSVEKMQALTAFVKDLASSEIFVTDRSDCGQTDV